MRSSADISAQPHVTVKQIDHPDGSRRVEIYRRPDGTFGFEQFQFGAEEQQWCPMAAHGTSHPVLDSYARALVAAAARIG